MLLGQQLFYLVTRFKNPPTENQIVHMLQLHILCV